MNEQMNSQSKVSRRAVLGGAGLGAIAAVGASAKVFADSKEQDAAGQVKGPDGPYAFVDGTGHGWVELGEKDFTNVNSAEDTWSWRDGVLYCTGQPISVMRSVKMYTNFEVCFEWNHRKEAGNSGMFIWSDKEVIEQMAKDPKPGLPSGIEVQVLDPGYRPEAQDTWFSTHGDVFPVRQTMDPFPPLSNDKHRSFPSEKRTKPHGNWNHYYVRAINGEVRLWVNGKEVSGGNNCSTRTGYICLESEGSPIEFRNIRLRELP